MATVKSLQIEADIDRKYGDHLAQFFAAFISDDKFRLVCDGKTLGSLPVTRPLVSEPDRQPTTHKRRSPSRCLSGGFLNGAVVEGAD